MTMDYLKKNYRIPKLPYEEVNRRIDITKRTRKFKIKDCLKVHNAPLKLASSIS